MDAIKKFKLRQDKNLRTTQEVDHKEKEIIFKKKEERKNDQKGKKINNTEDRKKAFQNSMKNFIIKKQRYDKTRRGYEFKIEDMVFVHSGNKLNRNKLDETRKGSFKILRRIWNTIYEVNGTGRCGGNCFHSRKLVPYGDDNHQEAIGTGCQHGERRCKFYRI